MTNAASRILLEIHHFFESWMMKVMMTPAMTGTSVSIVRKWENKKYYWVRRGSRTPVRIPTTESAKFDLIQSSRYILSSISASSVIPMSMICRNLSEKFAIHSSAMLSDRNFEFISFLFHQLNLKWIVRKCSKEFFHYFELRRLRRTQISASSFWIPNPSR